MVVNEPWMPPGADVLSAPLWDAFQKHCPEPLLDLHTIRCRLLPTDNSLSSRFGDHFYTLLGVSMRTFEIEFQGHDEDCPPSRSGQSFHALLEGFTVPPKLFIHLGQQCPQLQNFRLDQYLSPPNSTVLLAEAVYRWGSLRSFQILGTPLQES